MLTLTFLFFIIALLYSMVGFGGGSSYNAALVLFNVDHHIYPGIALLCNLIVVTSGCWLFMKRGFLSARLLLPFIITSIPMAHITGRIVIDETIFLSILGIALFISGLIMIFNKHLQDRLLSPDKNRHLWLWGLPIGACLGSLAGIVGIGGGIFLSPVLYFLGWGTARQIAATASGFIFVNSLAGVSGQYIKLQEVPSGLSQIAEYWPAFIAVFIGGQIGSRLSSARLSSQLIQQLTAVLVLYVSIRIGWMLIQPR